MKGGHIEFLNHPKKILFGIVFVRGIGSHVHLLQSTQVESRAVGQSHALDDSGERKRVRHVKAIEAEHQLRQVVASWEQPEEHCKLGRH